MPMFPGLIFAIILAVAEVVFGHAFVMNCLEMLRDGVPLVIDRVRANRYFTYLALVILVVVALPLTFGPLGIMLPQFSCSWGIPAARTLFVIGLGIAVVLLLLIWKLADIFAKAVIVILPFKTFENIRDGIEGFALTAAAWQVFVGFLLYEVGVYGSLKAIGGALFAFVGWWVVSEAYHRPTRLFPSIAITMFLVAGFIHIIQWVPTPVWIGLTGRDLRPVVNLESAVAVCEAHESNRVAQNTDETICTRTIQKKRIAIAALADDPSATLETSRRLQSELEDIENECAKKTAWWGQ